MKVSRRHISLCKFPSFPDKHTTSRRNSAGPSINWPEKFGHEGDSLLPPYDESLFNHVTNSTLSRIETDDSILHEYYEPILPFLSPQISTPPLMSQPPVPPKNRPLPPTSPFGDANVGFQNKNKTKTLPPTSRPPAPLPKPITMQHHPPLSPVKSYDQLSSPTTKTYARRRFSDLQPFRVNHIDHQNKQQWKPSITGVMNAEKKASCFNYDAIGLCGIFFALLQNYMSSQ